MNLVEALRTYARVRREVWKLPTWLGFNSKGILVQNDTQCTLLEQDVMSNDWVEHKEADNVP